MNLTKQKILHYSLIFKILGNPIRLSVINLLNENQELTVNEICKNLNCEQSLISHNLINMKKRGILVTQKKGANVYYSLKDASLINIITCLSKCKL